MFYHHVPFFPLKFKTLLDIMCWKFMFCIHLESKIYRKDTGMMSEANLCKNIFFEKNGLNVYFLWTAVNTSYITFFALAKNQMKMGFLFSRVLKRLFWTCSATYKSKGA